MACFSPLDDCGDRTNQLYWLKLLHTSYISLLNQVGKGRVFYSVDKCFETGADPRIIFDKQILKVWTQSLDTIFVGILLRDFACDFGIEFESSRHREIFEISLRAVKKL